MIREIWERERERDLSWINDIPGDRIVELSSFPSLSHREDV